MLMTTNRCLDYTKASKGLKLVAKNETMHLEETIRLPLQCMKSIQNKVQIKMEQISSEICSHIITDKQWLQENLLCLLSNAAKYSLQGEVTVRVSLANCSDLGSRIHPNHREAVEQIHASVLKLTPSGKRKNPGLKSNKVAVRCGR
jgi:signal transduction histidine kinase